MEPNAPDPSTPTGRAPDLEGAIREASAHLGIRYEAPDAPLSARATLGQIPWVPGAIGVLLLGAILAGILLVERRAPKLDPDRVEADLRWAAAEVVEEVNRQRSILGELPRPEALHGLLSEAIVYIPTGDTYRVVGLRDGVRVEFDGSIPLELWRSLVIYPPDAP